LDKTSVSMSDRADQLNLSRTKEDDDLIMQESVDKSLNIDKTSADQTSMVLTQAHTDTQQMNNHFIVGSHHLQQNNNN